MQDWEKRSPFLKVDVDQLIRQKAWRGLGGYDTSVLLWWWIERFRAMVEERFGLNVAAWFSCFLNSAFERICKDS